MKRIVVKGLLLLAFFLSLLTIVNWLNHQGYGLTYQDSRSMPEGWFVYHPLRLPLQRGEVVVFYPTPYWQAYLVNHGWLLPHALMMKEVYAVPGDEVCVRQAAVWINGHKTVPVLSDYAPGKALPRLVFCRKLMAGEYLLMSNHIVRSFDSRYFGPVERTMIVGEVVK